VGYRERIIVTPAIYNVYYQVTWDPYQARVESVNIGYLASLVLISSLHDKKVPWQVPT
jgi:hypothetical protein